MPDFASASSEIRVDSIVGNDGTSSVNVSFGASSTGNITGSGGINVSGILTASSFAGNGTGITGLDFATQGQAISFNLIG